MKKNLYFKFTDSEHWWYARKLAQKNLNFLKKKCYVQTERSGEQVYERHLFVGNSAIFRTIASAFKDIKNLSITWTFTIQWQWATIVKQSTETHNMISIM